MAGFVDVGNMSDEQVRRMGHTDDVYAPPARAWSRQPASQVGYAAEDVWAAACAAQRINGEYLRDAKVSYDAAGGSVHIDKMRNRDIMMQFLKDPAQLTEQDRAQAVEYQQYLAQDITFRALKGQLTDFDRATSKVLAVKDRFCTVKNKYELAVIACLPASVERSIARSNVKEKLAQCQPFEANIGDKVAADVEVVGCNYSRTYNIFWVQAVTDAGHAAMFSQKNPVAVGTRITIRGNVKAHRDQLTQLNRVKVVQ